MQGKLDQKIYAGYFLADRGTTSGVHNPPLIGQMVRFDTHLSTTLHHSRVVCIQQSIHVLACTYTYVYIQYEVPNMSSRAKSAPGGNATTARDLSKSETNQRNGMLASQTESNVPNESQIIIPGWQLSVT